MFSVLITYFAHVITTFLNMPKRLFSDFEDKKKVNAWSENNEFKPDEVSISSSEKFIFKCYECSHEFEIRLFHVTSGRWCPFCVNKLCGKKSCIPCYNKSFASFYDKDKVNSLSPKNAIEPHEIFKHCDDKFIFKCYKCEHEFKSKIQNITKNNGTWCPFCANKKLCEEKSCNSCVKKTFASFDKDKVKCWSPKNTFKPHEVFLKGRQVIIFNCDKCPHEFESVISFITNGRWCPFCAHNKLCGEKSCIPCYNKSFASFYDKDKVNSLSPKNAIEPHEIFKHCDDKFIFKCYKCEHEFKSTISKITQKKGTWCKFCYAMKNKFINKFFEIFDGMGMNYDVEIIVEYGNRLLKWDMVVYNNEREFYIESDGKHHFSVDGIINVNRGKIINEKAQKEFENQRERDLIKEKYIVDNDKLLFRISYKQFKQLENLVVIMISKSNDDDKGVVKMDDIYDW